MRKKILGLSLIALLSAVSLALTSCGGGGSSGTTPPPPPPPSSNGLTVYPGTASVPVGLTAQFTGYVPSQPGATVTWQVSGGSTNGTIDSTGKYTAPTSMPSAAQVTITATSGAFSGFATVTITAAQGLAVTPAAIAVPAGTKVPFAATGAVGAVTWQVNNVTGGDSSFGTIDANGNYSAPLSPPPGGSVTIAAINGANSGTAAATIVFSNASLSGNYAFSYTGDDGSGFLAVAGSFVADGNGNITSGMEDVNSLGGGVTTGNPILASTYTVGADGRATANVITGLGSGIIWQFALMSNQHGLMIRFDLNGSGSGAIDQQNTTEFGLSSITGNYSFGLSGIDINGLPLAISGLLGANANGGFPLNDAEQDINYNGTSTLNTSADTTLYGQYVFDTLNSTTGRGTIALTNSNALVANTAGTYTFTFYMVDSTHLKLVEIDTNSTGFLLAGDFFSAPNKDGVFDATILNGKYAFTTGGASANGPYSSAGVFTASGGTAGSTSGSISGGVFDSNDSGSVKQDQTLSASTYSVDQSLGRISFTLTIGTSTLHFAGYPTSTGSVEMTELDSNLITSGVAYQQTAGAAVQGSYALDLSGIASTKNGPVEQDIAGQVSPSTGGTLAGTLDINNFEDRGISEGMALLTGTVIDAADANGRGTLTLKTSNANFPLAYYIVNNNTVLLFEIDSQRVMPGTLVKQF